MERPDDARLMLQRLARRNPAPVTNLGVQSIKKPPRSAQGEAGVIEVGAAFAAGEAAIGVFAIYQKTCMLLTQSREEAGRCIARRWGMCCR